MKNIFKSLTLVLCALCFYQTLAVANIRPDVVAVAAGAGNLSIFVNALKTTGLVAILQGPGPFIVFAPTNAAFAKLPKGDLNALLKDKAQLKAILSYHISQGRVALRVIDNGPLPTLQGQAIVINKTNAQIRVNNARVVRANMPAMNGVVNEIDTVLMPLAMKNPPNKLLIPALPHPSE